MTDKSPAAHIHRQRVRNMIWGVAPKGAAGVYIEMHNVHEGTVSFQTLDTKEALVLMRALQTAVADSKNGVYERETPITITLQQKGLDEC